MDKPAIVEFVGRSLVIDRHGGVYVVTADGEARPVAGFGPDGEKALGFGIGPVASWFCSDRNITVLFHRTDYWAQKPLGAMPFLGILPEFPLVFSIQDGASQTIAVNGRDRLFVAEVTEDHIAERVVEAPFVGFTGWTAPPVTYIAGMFPRVEVDDRLEKWGTAATLCLSPQSAQIDAFEATDAVREISESVPRRLKGVVKIEACLASVRVRDRVWCVAPVIYDLMDADTDWSFGTRVGSGDYAHMVVLDYERGGARLIKDLPRVSYMTRTETDRFHYLWFRRVADTVAYEVMRIEKATGELRIEQATLDGFPVTGKPLYVGLWHHPTVGLYGCLGAYIDTGYEYFLMTSEDGFRWRQRQSLRKYGR